jgi:hypothetical protein
MNRFKILFIGIVLVFTANTLPAKTQIGAQWGGVVGSDCEKPPEISESGIYVSGWTRDGFIVNSKAIIEIRISRGIKLNEAHPETKPEWLKLEFSYDKGNSGEFTPSSVLYNILKPEYFLTQEQIEDNIRFSESQELPKRMGGGEVYTFTCDIPKALTGKHICVRAKESSIPYDALYTFFNLACKEVFAPCSIEDKNRALSSHVYADYRAGKDEAAIAMADSLIETGWISDIGFMIAELAAYRLKQPQKAEHYRDLMYESYGYRDIPTEY